MKKQRRTYERHGDIWKPIKYEEFDEKTEKWKEIQNTDIKDKKIKIGDGI